MLARACLTALLSLSASLAVAPGDAAAQALKRIWVSGKGTDAAGCGPVATPCRTVQFAHDAIAAGGEIDILDPAGYGAVTITKAVSIVNDGVGTAGILNSAPGSAAITVAAGVNDAVHLRGLSIDGLGVAATGILLNSAKSLDVVNCVVRHFTQHGLSLFPTNTASVTLLGVRASDNGVDGIKASPQGSGRVKGVFKNIVTTSNGSTGVNLQAGLSSASPHTIVVVGAVSSGNDSNSGRGFLVGAATATSTMTLRDVRAVNNRTGVIASGGAATIRIAHSVVSGNVRGADCNSSGEVASYGDNNIEGNGALNATCATVASR